MASQGIPRTYCLVFNITDLLQLSLNGTPFFPEKVYIHSNVILKTNRNRNDNWVKQGTTCLSVFHPFWNLFSAVAARSWNAYAIVLTMSYIEITIPRFKTNVLVFNLHIKKVTISFWLSFDIRLTVCRM